MPLSSVEVAVIQLFRERYCVDASISIDLERAVLGSDYGASGYTTVSQAEALASVLMLRKGLRLLDVGAGCGWPGLYLAAKTGCDVVVTDLPIEGMRRAQRRAVRDELEPRVGAVVATARHLPFVVESFDAIVHTDVLC